MRKYPINSAIKDFASVFQKAGFSLYLVGGSVRDWLLHLPNDDYDFCTDALPSEVRSLFRHVIPTGIEHGTVTVLYKSGSYEVTTFRTEEGYSDMRHPDEVTFVRSLEEDLKRRDFTINAFAVNCVEGKIIDLHDGYLDLKARTIRAIGNPHERFQEDALRIMRALRFASRLDFDIEEQTFLSMEELAPNLLKVSKERIHEELCKLLMTDHPSKGLSLMVSSGVMDILFPTLSKGKEVLQNGMHHDTVLEHCIACAQAAANHHYPLFVRLAALFHDIGKSDTVVYREDANTYYGHDKKGAEMTEDILRGLKASNEEISIVSLLVREHMFRYTHEWSDGAVRRFINRVGKTEIEDLFRLRFADEESTSGRASYESIRELDERIKKVYAQSDALSLKDLAVHGNDLMEIGIKGPLLGKTLTYLLDVVIDDPLQNEKGKLIALARDYFASASSVLPIPSES